MALPKYFTDGPGKHKKSQRQEKRVAGALGGKTQKGSGSKAFHKGDVKSAELLVECKRTDADSMSVKKDWLIKIWNEAASYGKTPALSIEFDSMPGIIERDWVAVPASVLRRLIEYFNFVSEQEDD